MVCLVLFSHRLKGLFLLRFILTLKLRFTSFFNPGASWIFIWNKPNFSARLRLPAAGLASSAAGSESITRSRAPVPRWLQLTLRSASREHIKIHCTRGVNLVKHFRGFLSRLWLRFPWKTLACSCFPLHAVVTHWKKGHFTSSLPACYLCPT